MPKLYYLDSLAEEIMEGKWGNGAERQKKLKEAGLNYHIIQNYINKHLNNTLGDDDYDYTQRHMYLPIPDTDNSNLGALPEGRGTMVLIPNGTPNEEPYRNKSEIGAPSTNPPIRTAPRRLETRVDDDILDQSASTINKFIDALRQYLGQSDIV